MFITPLLLVGALRLSRPHAPWARWRYTDPTARRCTGRWSGSGSMRRPVVQAKLWLQDAVAGMPRFPDDARVDAATRPRDPCRATADRHPPHRVGAA